MIAAFLLTHNKVTHRNTSSGCCRWRARRGPAGATTPSGRPARWCTSWPVRLYLAGLDEGTKGLSKEGYAVAIIHIAATAWFSAMVIRDNSLAPQHDPVRTDGAGVLDPLAGPLDTGPGGSSGQSPASPLDPRTAVSPARPRQANRQRRQANRKCVRLTGGSRNYGLNEGDTPPPTATAAARSPAGWDDCRPPRRGGFRRNLGGRLFGSRRLDDTSPEGRASSEGGSEGCLKAVGDGAMLPDPTHLPGIGKVSTGRPSRAPRSNAVPDPRRTNDR